MLSFRARKCRRCIPRHSRVFIRAAILPIYPPSVSPQPDNPDTSAESRPGGVIASAARNQEGANPINGRAGKAPFSRKTRALGTIESRRSLHIWNRSAAGGLIKITARRIEGALPALIAAPGEDGAMGWRRRTNSRGSRRGKTRRNPLGAAVLGFVHSPRARRD